MFFGERILERVEDGSADSLEATVYCISLFGGI
ncbi:hypothetical protein HMPREF1285_01937 [Corynebacterium sp. KPL1859]|nr:hypothetical protein HMPREF1285_01937 [Corynebacterium sp. KPL1859]